MINCSYAFALIFYACSNVPEQKAIPEPPQNQMEAVNKIVEPTVKINDSPEKSMAQTSAVTVTSPKKPIGSINGKKKVLTTGTISMPPETVAGKMAPSTANPSARPNGSAGRASTLSPLSSTERNEMKKLEKEMAAAESRKKEILNRFNDAALGAEEATKLSSELGKLQESLDNKELRWLELAERT